MSKIADVIQDILDKADDAKREYDADHSNDMEFGRLLAFTEVLSVLKCEYLGEEEVDAMLGFDIDKRYTCA